MKSRPEDFRVVELPALAPAGTGEHLLLRIEKTGLSTHTVAGELARAFAVAEVAVGYAGMKDRHAVTEQWFSVHTPHDADADAVASVEGIRVLEAHRHLRKLRRGELKGNRFVIVLRGVAGASWPARLADIAAAGVPNYFGPQRFGGDNLAQALEWLPRRRRRRDSAFRAGLHLSVLRSFLFNEVLAARVRDATWAQFVPGDVLATLCDPGQGDGPRAPSGPLWGRGRPPAREHALAVETAALEPHREIREGLEHAGLAQERRSLVLLPWGLRWQSTDDTVTVEFALPPGGYATVLLGEAFDLHDGAKLDAAG